MAFLTEVMCTCEAEAIAAPHPRWEDLLRLRARCDPRRKFLNPYLSRIFIGERAARPRYDWTALTG